MSTLDTAESPALGRDERISRNHAASVGAGRGSPELSCSRRERRALATGNCSLRAPTDSTSCSTSSTSQRSPWEERETNSRCGRCSGARRSTKPAAASTDDTRSLSARLTRRSMSPRSAATEPRRISHSIPAASSPSKARRRSAFTEFAMGAPASEESARTASDAVLPTAPGGPSRREDLDAVHHGIVQGGPTEAHTDWTTRIHREAAYDSLFRRPCSSENIE